MSLMELVERLAPRPRMTRREKTMLSLSILLLLLLSLWTILRACGP